MKSMSIDFNRSTQERREFLRRPYDIRWLLHLASDSMPQKFMKLPRNWTQRIATLYFLTRQLLRLCHCLLPLRELWRIARSWTHWTNLSRTCVFWPLKRRRDLRKLLGWEWHNTWKVELRIGWSLVSWTLLLSHFQVRLLEQAQVHSQSRGDQPWIRDDCTLLGQRTS